MASLDKMVAQAAERFEPNEAVEAAVLGISRRLSAEVGLQKPAVLVATNLRVVVFAKDLLGEAFESYSYPEITSVITQKTATLGSEATLTVPGGAVSVYRISKGDVPLFESKVREHMEAVRAQAAERARKRPSRAAGQRKRAGGARGATATKAATARSAAATPKKAADAAAAETVAPAPVEPAGVVCPNCGARNPEGTHYCGQCGGPLARMCPQCGAMVTSRYCGECGSLVPRTCPKCGAVVTTSYCGECGTKLD